MSDELISLYRKAFDAYLSVLPRQFSATASLFSYSTVELTENAPWWNPIVSTMIAENMREVINEIHEWSSQLTSLRAWSEVSKLDDFDDQDHWTVRSALINPLAIWCLLQPAASRDRLGNVATMLLHQARLSLDPSYKDMLDQDNRRGRKNSFLNRPHREAQLARLGQSFELSAPFMAALRDLDDVPFRRATFDFRNRSAHSIAPRLEEGVTHMATRFIGSAQNMVNRADGMYDLVDDPLRDAVYYGLGGTPPLRLTDVVSLVGEEYAKAHVAVGTLVTLTEHLIDRLFLHRSNNPAD